MPCSTQEDLGEKKKPNNQEPNTQKASPKGKAGKASDI